MSDVKPLTGKKLEAYQRWFDRWWEEDFSWDGENGEMWLRRDFTSDVFSDELEDGNQPLFGYKYKQTSRQFTRYHYPLYTYEGKPTGKLDESRDTEKEIFLADIKAQTERLLQLVASRALSGGELDLEMQKFDSEQHFLRYLNERRPRLTGVSIGSDFDLSVRFAPEEDKTKAFDHILIDADFVFFLSSVSAHGCLINGDAGFTSATISGDARFESATISGDARFTGANIIGGAQFTSVTISGDARFTGANISGGARFESATIGGDARFNNAAIIGGARFTSATISGDAWFESATISGDARFESATISGHARFQSVSISGHAWFERVIISGHARFTSATISRSAWFERATISGSARFTSATISGRVRFTNSIFQGAANFSLGYRTDSGKREGIIHAVKALYGNEREEQKILKLDREKDHASSGAFNAANFSGAIFFGPVTFQNRRFKEETDFSDAWFFDIAKFHDCTLHKDTQFTLDNFALPPKDNVTTLSIFSRARSQIQDAQKLDTIENFLKEHDNLGWSQRQVKEKYQTRDKFSYEYERAFRTLKDHMEKARARTAEQQFYKYELQSRVRVGRSDLKFGERFFANAYGLLADYGTSAIRPLLSLGVLVVVFSVIYGVLYRPLLEPLQALSMAVQIAMPLSLGFYPLRSLNTDQLSISLNTDPAIGTHFLPPESILGLTMVVTVQAFLSLILWFLFALALRRRFQIN